MRRVAIDCLNCGHTASMAESALAQLGFAADVSLVVVTKSESKAVRAYRYIDDEIQPVFQGPPIVPKQ